MMRPFAIAAAALVLSAAPVSAQPASLAAALRAGQVGERFDGYMGYAVPSVSPEVRRQVSAVNLQRRNLYLQLASRRQVNAQVVGIATGCELIAHLSAGQAYMLGDTIWRRVVAGQKPPSPDYCR